MTGTVPPPPGAERRHYPLLDAGRGVAAIAVLLHHVGNESGAGLAPYGYLAVDYFLMLSGFVIALAYEDKLQSGMSYGRFLRLRVQRIWPMIVMGSALAVVAAWVKPDPGIRPQWLLYQFLLIPAFTAWVIFPANGPLWSLFYEVVANVAHALCLRRMRLAWLVLLLVPLAIGVLAIVATQPEFNIGFRPHEWSFALVRIFAGYTLGIVAFRLLRDGRLPLLDVGPLPPLLLVAAPLLAPAAVPGDVVVIAALFLLFPLAILLGIGSRPGLAPLAGWLGGISYPLYAIHMPFLLIGEGLGWRTPLGWTVLALAALASATLLERVYDAPLRAWFRRRNRRAPFRRLARSGVATTEDSMADLSQVKEHMEVIGADGTHVGTVDKVDGNRIKLTKKDTPEAAVEQGQHTGHHHYISGGLVAEVEGDKVRLSANGDVAVTLEEEA